MKLAARAESEGDEQSDDAGDGGELEAGGVADAVDEPRDEQRAETEEGRASMLATAIYPLLSPFGESSNNAGAPTDQWVMSKPESSEQSSRMG